ncbi:MAG TPA: isoprenylcysteine carboxylmethyltransferase family protein [Anaerolineales bacterium]|nr:isoprenylcysteine carboxylmethyltransferase family protein [Anaerolineales bacterium]
MNVDQLRRRVIARFFLGLLFLAAIAIVIGWALERAGGWGTFYLGWPNQALGLALTLAGSTLVVWAVRLQYTLGRGTPAPMMATQRLVTQGPYACTRNPMTLGALLLYLGIGVWMGAGIVIILVVIVFSLLLTHIYIHETQELIERFGDEYLTYKKHTPFLLPRFWFGDCIGSRQGRNYPSQDQSSAEQ